MDRSFDRHPDALVVGVGPAGAVAATVLAGAGLRVVVLDAEERPRRRPAEVLPPQADPLVDRLRLRPILDGDRVVARPCGGVASWWGGKDLPDRQRFRSLRGGSGWILERPAFDSVLADLAEHAGARCYRGLRVRAVERHGERWNVLATSRNGRESSYSPSFLIDATGRAALVARLAGAKMLRFDRLVAASLQVPPGNFPEPGWLWVEAVEDGWLYSVLSPSGEASVVFVTCTETRGSARSRLVRAVIQAGTTGRRVGRTSELAPGRVLAAGSQRLDAVAGKGWIAVGDAATSFDPLASQGLFNALASGYFGAHAALAAMDGDTDAGRDYEASIFTAHASTLALTRQVYGLANRGHPPRPFWVRRREALVAP